MITIDIDTEPSLLKLLRWLFGWMFPGFDFDEFDEALLSVLQKLVDVLVEWFWAQYGQTASN